MDNLIYLILLCKMHKKKRLRHTTNFFQQLHYSMITFMNDKSSYNYRNVWGVHLSRSNEKHPFKKKKTILFNWTHTWFSHSPGQFVFLPVMKIQVLQKQVYERTGWRHDYTQVEGTFEFLSLVVKNQWLQWQYFASIRDNTQTMFISCR